MKIVSTPFMAETATLYLNCIYNLVCCVFYYFHSSLKHCHGPQGAIQFFNAVTTLIQLTEMSSIKCSGHQSSVKKLEITVLTQIIQMNCQRSQSFCQINQFELYSLWGNRISWIHKLYTSSALSFNSFYCCYLWLRHSLSWMLLWWCGKMPLNFSN